MLAGAFSYNSAIQLRILQVKEIVSSLGPKTWHIVVLIWVSLAADKALPMARGHCPPARSPLLCPNQATCSDRVGVWWLAQRSACEAE